MKATRTCSIDGCELPHSARGLCKAHYMRWWKSHPDKTPVATRTPEERFWAKVQGGDVTTCWLWMGSTADRGYGGTFRPEEGAKSTRPHRWAYEHLIGPIPEGLEIDHLCRNRACVNPWHLEPVTAVVNTARAHRYAPTHCPQGHEYTPENTYHPPNKPNSRQCRTCRRTRAQEVKRMKRAARQAEKG